MDRDYARATGYAVAAGLSRMSLSLALVAGLSTSGWYVEVVHVLRLHGVSAPKDPSKLPSVIHIDDKGKAHAAEHGRHSVSGRPGVIRIHDVSYEKITSFL